MMRIESSTRSRLPDRRHIYGLISIICSVALSFLFYELGCDTIPAVAISLSCAALVLSRWQVFAIAMALAVFCAVVFGGMVLRDVPLTRITTRSSLAIEGHIVSDDGGQVVIRDATGENYRVPSTDVVTRQLISAATPKSLRVLLCLVLIASAFRFAACLAADRPSRMLTSRLNYTPLPQSPDVVTPWHWPELTSLVFISASLGISSWLCAPLNQTLRLGPHIGLIPEAYFAIKIVLFMAVLVGVSRGVLSYLSIWFDGGSLASLHLRRELWKSNGSEERRIARQAKMNG